MAPKKKKEKGLQRIDEYFVKKPQISLSLEPPQSLSLPLQREMTLVDQLDHLLMWLKKMEKETLKKMKMKITLIFHLQVSS